MISGNQHRTSLFFIRRVIFLLIITIAFISCDNSEAKLDEIRRIFASIGLDNPSGQVFTDAEILNSSESREFIISDPDSFTFVFFGASWCPSCQKELPTIEALQRSLSENVAVKFVFISENPGTVARFMESNNYTVPYMLDRRALAASSNAVEKYPTAYLVSPKGKTIFRVEGLFDWSDPILLSAIEDSLEIWY